MSESVPVTGGLFATQPDGSAALLGGACPDCGKHHFPASPDCPFCSGERCTTQPLSSRGTLRLFTTVVNRPPGYVGEVPFGFGVVELPEGVQLISRLTESDPARLAFGMPMRLALVPLHVDESGRTVLTYAFAPEGAAR
ncbi:MAG: Zn-ribbon domain-containing OB-fold protein [Candidatus Binatia bacterium]